MWQQPDQTNYEEVGEGMSGGMEYYPEEEYTNGPTLEYQQQVCLTVEPEWLQMQAQMPITVTKFDNHEEMLWAANGVGHISGFWFQKYQPPIKYCSFNLLDNEPIRDIVTGSNCVFAAQKNGITSFKRTGQVIETIVDPNITSNIQALHILDDDKLLVGCEDSNKVTVFNCDKLHLTSLQTWNGGMEGVSMFRPLDSSNAQKIMFGDSSGELGIFDLRTQKPEHSIHCYSGGLYDFVVHGSKVITCGYVVRTGRNIAGGRQEIGEKFLKMYDLRSSLKPINPIALNFEPRFIKLANLYSDRLILVSRNGGYQLLEINSAPQTVSILPGTVDPDRSCCEAFDISTSLQTLSFGDNFGVCAIHSTENGKINPKSLDRLPNPWAENNSKHYPVSIEDDQDSGRYKPCSLVPLPMPSDNGPLASEWPDELCQIIYREPLPVDPQILKNIIHSNERMITANNPRTRLRNQCPYDMGDFPASDDNELGDGESIFDDDDLHVKLQQQPRRPNTNAELQALLVKEETHVSKVPKPYRRVTPIYSRFSADEFNFFHYNRTQLPGLEPNCPGSWLNPLLQSLYFIEPLRVACLNHLCPATADFPICLACEMQFLFHMLDSQKEPPVCQPSNFMRGLRSLPLLRKLGVLSFDENANPPTSESSSNASHELCLEKIGKMSANPQNDLSIFNVHSLLRFTVMSIFTELHLRLKDDPIIDLSPKISIRDTNISRLCGLPPSNCGLFNHQPRFCVDFDYSKPESCSTFHDMLQHSLRLLWSPVGASCGCDKPNQVEEGVDSNTIPPVLFISTGLKHFGTNTEDVLAYWRSRQNAGSKDSRLTKKCRYGRDCRRENCRFIHPESGSTSGHSPTDASVSQHWLPDTLKIGMVDGEVKVCPSEESDSDSSTSPLHIYNLMAVLCHVIESKTSNGGLVTSVRVSKPAHARRNIAMEEPAAWYLFNQFVATEISRVEALTFDAEWKLPVLLILTRHDVNTSWDLTEKCPILPEVLLSGDTDRKAPSPGATPSVSSTSVSSYDISSQPKYLAPIDLALEDFPGQGDLVGIDTEFVSERVLLSHYQSVFEKVDSVRFVNIPAPTPLVSSTPANSSSKRAGAAGGSNVVGSFHMVPGRVTVIRAAGHFAGLPFIDDYMVSSSSHNNPVVPFKTTYVKLRALIDRGVVFVGHGLKKDFRVLNISVPPNQIIDTVELYHLPKQRFVSLRYLSWYILSQSIQLDPTTVFKYRVLAPPPPNPTDPSSQIEGAHDCVEDARAALALYRKHCEYWNRGPETLRGILVGLYDTGKDLSWKVPDKDSGTSSTSQSSSRKKSSPAPTKSAQDQSS